MQTMKIFVLLILAFAAQCQAYRSYDFISEKVSSESMDNSYEDKWRGDYEELPLFSPDVPRSQFQSSASRLPEAQSFMKKISQRLAGSDVFSADFEYRQRLIQTADRKLEKCKIPGGLELDQQCVDRAVGQIMQMIANIENNGH